MISGFFNIVHTENPGAAFGILADSPSAWSSMLLVAVSLVVMAIIGVMLWRPHRHSEIPAWFPWDWRWCSAARSAMSGTGCSAAR